VGKKVVSWEANQINTLIQEINGIASSKEGED